MSIFRWFVAAIAAVVILIPAALAFDSGNVDVVNNASGKDIITVSGVAPKSVITIKSSSGAFVASGSTGSKTSKAFKVSQLGSAAGTLVVTVSEPGRDEVRATVSYAAEPVSAAPNSDNITAANNVDSKDTVTITGAAAKATVYLYADAQGTSLLAKKKISSDGSLTLKLKQLGSGGTTVYLALHEKKKAVSERVAVTVPAETVTADLTAGQVTLENNADSKDFIILSNVKYKDQIFVYSDSGCTTLLAKGKVGKNKSELTLKHKQLGETAGSVYITIRSYDQKLSSAVSFAYADEPQTEVPGADDVVITNNAGAKDTVVVSGLTKGDQIIVYDGGGVKLGTAKCAGSKTTVTVKVSQLGESGGTISLTKKSKGSKVSAKLELTVEAEPISKAIDAGDVEITNKPTGTKDTVFITNLEGKDKVTIYQDNNKKTTLVTKTLSASAYNITLSLTQLGKDGGTVYISRTGAGERESELLEITFVAENASDPADSEKIAITNNAGLSDTIIVTGLKPDSVVTAYSSRIGTAKLGSAAASQGTAVITVSQLGSGAGTVWLAVTEKDSVESERVQAAYNAETAVQLDTNVIGIRIVNNAGQNDTIYVTGLEEADVIHVYSETGTKLGSATVADYADSVTVNIPQLGRAEGMIWITLTRKGYLESERVSQEFDKEVSTDAASVLISANVDIRNNAGSSDTITVTNLQGKDIIKVYQDADRVTLLGSAAVSESGTGVTITIGQLGIGSGEVYMTLTRSGYMESAAVDFAYDAEGQSQAIDISKAAIENNYNIASTIHITGLNSGDIIKVYETEASAAVLATGTVSEFSNELTLNIANLSEVEGTLYVSRTSSGKSESGRAAVPYGAKSQTAAPSASTVSVMNQAGSSDTITVTGLEPGDVVRLYDGEAASSASAKATAADSSVTLNANILSADGGTVYITLQRTGRTESRRVAISYLAESAAPVAGDVSVLNNMDIADVITVTNVVSGDIVSIYSSASAVSPIASVTASGTSVAITVNQLTAAAGNIFVTVTKYGRCESSRTMVGYLAEQASAALDASSITIQNKPLGTNDIITVNGLAVNDIVYVYSNSGTLLGSAAASGGSVTITIAEIGANSGTLQISRKSQGKGESARIHVSFAVA